MAVRSPCINVCRIEPGTGWCEGCSRTLEEIAAWSQLSDAQRAAVLARLPSRRPLQPERMQPLRGAQDPRAP